MNFPGIIHKEVNQSVNFDAHENSVDQCTHKEESCELNQMMSYLSKDQKQLLNSLYKIGQKCVTSESHVDFLSRSLEEEFIPKRFKLKNNLPGNSRVNQERLDAVSLKSILDEKLKQVSILKTAKIEFEKVKKIVKELFNKDDAVSVIERVEAHLYRISKKLSSKKSNKAQRLLENDVTNETNDSEENAQEENKKKNPQSVIYRL